ncbi:MAG: hypothetical protein GWN86_26280 [Desulfobacterales bacterium]|nr:hypothetical protein [Desulfobacterales bacterium]
MTAYCSHTVTFSLRLLAVIAKVLAVSAFILFSIGDSRGGEGLSIGRMRIAIWPEYDDPGVLAIYDGRFAESSRFPLRTSFLIPKGAVISDACSLSPKGQHFCQLYETANKGEFDEVTLYLPFPNFYLSFHTPSLKAEGKKRAIDYRIRTNHEIEKLEVDIQEPLRSTKFKVSPASDVISNAKGFNHYEYTFNGVPEGAYKVFRIGYIKEDRLPSVDIKYSRMSGDRVWGSPYDAQKRAMSVIYILLATGAVALAGTIIWILRSRRRRKQDEA